MAVVVHHQIGILKVHTLTRRVCGHQHAHILSERKSA